MKGGREKTVGTEVTEEQDLTILLQNRQGSPGSGERSPASVVDGLERWPGSGAREG